MNRRCAESEASHHRYRRQSLGIGFTWNTFWSISGDRLGFGDEPNKISGPVYPLLFLPCIRLLHGLTKLPFMSDYIFWISEVKRHAWHHRDLFAHRTFQKTGLPPFITPRRLLHSQIALTAFRYPGILITDIIPTLRVEEGTDWITRCKSERPVTLRYMNKVSSLTNPAHGSQSD